MHEHTLAMNILKTAHDAAKGQKILKIVLEIGEIADIPPQELVDAIKHIVKYDVEYAESESKIKCSCGYIGRSRILEKKHAATIFVCPECNNSNPEVLTGKDIIIKEIEVED